MLLKGRVAFPLTISHPLLYIAMVLGCPPRRYAGKEVNKIEIEMHILKKRSIAARASCIRGTFEIVIKLVHFHKASEFFNPKRNKGSVLSRVAIYFDFFKYTN